MRIRLLLAPALVALLGLLIAAGRAAGKPVATVLYFDNNSGRADYDVQRKGLADMLITDLSASDELVVVEREKIEHLLAELKLQRSRFFDPATAQRMGRGLGAQYAITGAFAAAEPDMRIDIRLVEVATGRVMMADSVVGAHDRFFELEQQLAARFLSGLHIKLVRAAASGRTDEKALLKYSLGLQAADRGDLKAASQRLAEVVREAPEFKLAESRYAEILQRMSTAVEKRTTELSDIAAALTRQAEEGLRGPRLDPLYHSHCERLGARALASAIPLARIDGLLLKSHFKTDKFIPQAQWGALLGWMKEYVTQQQKLIEELKECSADPGRPCNCADWSGDAATAHALDVLGQPRNRSIRLKPEVQQHDLAAFLILGRSWWREIRPTLGLLEPRYAELAFSLFDGALAELDRHPDPYEWKTISLLDDYAESLLLAGRKMQAVARWQMILDRYPRYKDFYLYKAKMERALGVTKEMQTLRALKASCTHESLTNGLQAATVALSESVGPADGVRGLVEWTDALWQSCAGVPSRGALVWGYAAAAGVALEHGDCATHLQLVARAVQQDPMHLLDQYLKQFEGICQ
jgi:TolB-like protein